MNELDIQVLIDARDEAVKRVTADPSRRNLAALEKAVAMVRDRSGSAAAGDGPQFKNRLEVLLYLQQQGYKVKKSKIYKDVKDGLLRLNADGSSSLAQVEKYVSHPKSGLLKLKKDAAGGLLPSPEIEDLQRRKLQAEIRKIEEYTSKLTFEREKEAGRHISRDLLDMELASRAAVFEAGIKYIITRKSAEWVNLVNGSSTMVDTLIDAMNMDMDELLNGIATTDRFTVEFR